MRHLDLEVDSQMLQQPEGNDLDGLQCPTGHLHESKLHRESEPEIVAVPSPDGLQLVGGEGEEVSDLDVAENPLGVL